MLHNLWLKKIECMSMLCDLWHVNEDDSHYCMIYDVKSRRDVIVMWYVK